MNQSTPFNLTFLRYIVILSFHLNLGFPSFLFLSVLLTKTLLAFVFCPMPATCTADVIHLDLVPQGTSTISFETFSDPLLLLFIIIRVTYGIRGEVRNTYMYNFHRKVFWDLTSQMSCERMKWLRILYTKQIIWWRYWTLVFYKGRRNSGFRNFICFNKNCITELNGVWFH